MAWLNHLPHSSSGVFVGDPRFADIDLSEFSPNLSHACRAVVEVFRRRFPGDLPDGIRPIRCYYREGQAEVYTVPLPRSYQIGLCVKGDNHPWFVFLFAHELGHIILGTGGPLALMETLACAISLIALSDIALAWALRPPFPGARQQALQMYYFGDYYLRGYLKRPERAPQQVKDAIRLEDWRRIAIYLNYRRYDHERCHHERNPDYFLSLLAATALASGKVPWHEFVGFCERITTGEKPDFTHVSLAMWKALRRTGRGLNVAVERFAERPRRGRGFVFPEGEGWTRLREDRGSMAALEKGIVSG